MRGEFWTAFLILGFLAPVAYAAGEEAPTATCLSEIRRVCAQMEDDLEACLQERGARLSSTCRKQLQEAIRMASDPQGMGACVADVKRLCGDRELPDLSACIEEKRSQFSEACQKQMAGPSDDTSRPPQS